MAVVRQAEKQNRGAPQSQAADKNGKLRHLSPSSVLTGLGLKFAMIQERSWLASPLCRVLAVSETLTFHAIVSVWTLTKRQKSHYKKTKKFELGSLKLAAIIGVFRFFRRLQGQTLRQIRSIGARRACTWAGVPGSTKAGSGRFIPLRNTGRKDVFLKRRSNNSA